MEHQLRPEEALNFAFYTDVNQAAHQDRAQEKISGVVKELNESTMDDVGPIRLCLESHLIAGRMGVITYWQRFSH
jgi:hypothetical protein